MSDSGSILRVLDANANRAREALRVLEDYARFVLNSPSLSADLKAIRHDLTTALLPILADAILHRDTTGDVGTTNKTAAELAREDIAHVVTAAGKRFGEAIRCLEEFAKTINPAIAAKLESIRYRFYTVEQTLALTLHSSSRFSAVRLYVLITQAHCAGRPWQSVAEQAIAGGADCLQLREKDLDAGEMLTRAREFIALCRKHNVISIINDRVDVALVTDADGVHVGQTDLPVRDVRRILGRSRIIGVSTHCLDHARQAVLDGADYIGVGPVFRSTTKARDILPGLEYARQVAAEINIPAVAIAGINADNIAQVISTGLRAVAVTAAVTEQPDVAGAARQLKNAIP